MPTCFITGCGGFIGSHLSEWLLSQGCRPVGIVRSNTRHIAHLTGRLEVHAGEITDRAQLVSLLRAVQPEFVFHLAALYVIQASWRDPKATFETNVLGTISLLEAVREARPDAVVQIAGSGVEYGPSTPEELPIAETRVPRPVNPYALSKTAAVELGRLYAMRYGMRVHSVRPFQLVGPRKYPDACSEFARGIVEVERGRATDLPVGDLEVVRDLLDVRDGVKAMWLIARSGQAGEVYNICSGVGYRLGDILERFMDLARIHVRVREDPARLRPLDVPVIVGDNAKLRCLGWQMEIPLERTLAGILDYWRQVPE
jgi:GDP-4-dehydro-6-deoxy-D-mannose reductase